MGTNIPWEPCIEELFVADVPDELLLSTEDACRALGRKGRPTSPKYIQRAKKNPTHPLNFMKVAGLDFFTIGFLRDHVRARTVRPNPARRERRGGAYARPAA